ncbi:YolD-like protein [Cytobacillus oceanisediminis]|uniref:YolD-like protein n=1 Tax=Cytobacillus oceanisediminis TaxID=665099 RepID=A0A2V2ZUV8_9BACI|nr:YolD-like family protein [Cytobacillus oceanisediminis]PWW28206.1 YolD-like protein [Cytobacillus oceanisediminis]
MPLKNRGLLKWLPAHFMPKHRAILKKLEIEQNYQYKPLIDEYEMLEYENRIHYAMEFASIVKVKVWREGFFHDFKGRVNRLDGFSKKIYIETDHGYIQKIVFDEIVRVEAEE